uniref:hypothetical protein n=1 Tax=Tessaracoccus timonensis TaxID=2161816 RepID=UPI000D5567D4|nr:hypothetical protein [Tessaracoccus timonensis]
MTNPELAKDPEAFLAHLDAQIDALIRKSAELDAVGGSGAATDPTGTVTVEFGQGGNLQTISVAPAWEQKIQPEELVPVITETLILARDGDGEPARIVELSDEEVARIRQREEAEISRSMQSDRTPEQTAELAASLSKAFDDLNAKFANLLAHSDKARTHISEEPVEVETVASYSENQMVGVKTVNGVAVGVTIRPSWVAGKSGLVITECFTEAIQGLADASAAQPHQ